MSYLEDYKSDNPVLQDKMFKETDVEVKERMTLEGTLNKIGVSFAFLFVASIYGWGNSSLSLTLIGFFGSFSIAFLTMSKRNLATYTVPVYALFQGVFLGSFSAMIDRIIPGILSQAIFVTILILGVILGSYHMGILKATPRFKKMIILATTTILAMYVINFVLSFFGFGLPMVNGSNLLGTLLSFFVVGVAALNLVVDFDLIEKSIEQGLPKHMEWYGAFAIMVTIVWLYVEVTRLIKKIRAK